MVNGTHLWSMEKINDAQLVLRVHLFDIISVILLENRAV